MVHITTNIICGILIIYMFVFAKKKTADLPDTIPIHFNFSGKADGYGNKKTIYLFPVLAVLALICFNFIPADNINYAVPITEANKDIQFLIAKFSLNIMLVFLVWISFFIESLIVKIVKTGVSKIPAVIWWVVLLSIVLTFVPIIFSYIYR